MTCRKINSRNDFLYYEMCYSIHFDKKNESTAPDFAAEKKSWVDWNKARREIDWAGVTITGVVLTAKQT